MRSIIIALAVLCCASATFAGETKIQQQPFGFSTIDFSEEFWSSVGEDQKLEGVVHELISYQDVKRVVIIRCNMSVPGVGDFLDRFIQEPLEATNQFYTESIPKWDSAYRYPWLTALLETEDGGLALLNIYPEFSVIEFKGRFGMILKKKNLESDAQL